MATSSSKRRTMHKVAESAPPPSYSAFFPGTTTTGIPKHTVFYAIYPDEILQLDPYFITKAEYQELISSLHSIHLRILDIVSPYITDYIWQHEHFSLSISSSSNPNPKCPCSPETLPHFHGKTKYGENLEDEWFIVFLLFQVSRRIRNLTIRVWDSDGEFLLFESAEHLFILDSSNTKNRVFIRGGELHIVHDEILPSNAPLVEFLSGLARCGGVGAPYSADSSFKKLVSGYPERAQSNMHRVKVRVPVSVAKVLKHEPCLISLAVEGFCNRGSDSMKFVINMEKFQSGVGGTGKEELIRVSVRMSRAMYAKLAQQTFEAPECYPMPPRTDSSAYVEAMLGMKIACGFEVMYQQRRHEGMEVKGSTWEDFKESLKSSGEMMNAPVRHIDEILALPHTAEEFKGLDLPPSDDDAWLYNGQDELKLAMSKRQEQMKHFEPKGKKSKKANKKKGADQSAANVLNKDSGYKDAHFPVNRDSTAVDPNLERFIKYMKSLNLGPEGTVGDADTEEGSSSDFDFDYGAVGYDCGSGFLYDDFTRWDAFMDDTDELYEELKFATMMNSFFHANEQSFDNEGTSNDEDESEDELTPTELKSLVDFFPSQQGLCLPRSASTFLGLIGQQLPKDARKGSLKNARKGK